MATEARVAEPGLALRVDCEGVMAAHAVLARRREHPGEHGPRRIAERAERRAEQGVVLEAIAAATAGHQLGRDIGERKARHLSEQRVDVLERDRAHMGLLHRSEPPRARGHIGQADPVEIAVEAETVHVSVPRRSGQRARRPGAVQDVGCSLRVSRRGPMAGRYSHRCGHNQPPEAGLRRPSGIGRAVRRP